VSTVSAITEELYSCIPEITDPDPASPYKKFMICEGCGGTGIIVCEGFVYEHTSEYTSKAVNRGTKTERFSEWLALITSPRLTILPYRCDCCDGVGHHILR
jgi:hypothetical protein